MEKTKGKFLREKKPGDINDDVCWFMAIFHKFIKILFSAEAFHFLLRNLLKS